MQLYYREFGTDGDQPLVILHGLFGMSDNWVSMARRIAGEGFHVLVPDQRNHGRSGHTSIHNYPAMVDDLFEFLDARSKDSIFLLGHSMGGKVAMQFSFDYPEMVEKLAIADISPAAGTHGRVQTTIIDALLRVDLESYDNRSKVLAGLRGLIANDRLMQFLQKNLYWKDKGSMGWRMNLPVLKEHLSDIFSAIHSDTPFEKDVLFVRGERSDYVPETDYPLIRSLFPNVLIHTIPDASHWLHAEHPGQFSRVLIDFFGVQQESP